MTTSIKTDAARTHRTAAGMSGEDLAWLDRHGWNDGNIPPPSTDEIAAYERREAALNSAIAGLGKQRTCRIVGRQARRRNRGATCRSARSRRRGRLEHSRKLKSAFPLVNPGYSRLAHILVVKIQRLVPADTWTGACVPTHGGSACFRSTSSR